MTPKPDSPLTAERAADLFRLFAHPTRVEILTHLSSRSSSRGELGDALMVPSNTLQKHLSKLRDRGVIEYDRDAGVYRITDRNAVERLHAALPEIFPAPPSPLPPPDDPSLDDDTD